MMNIQHRFKLNRSSLRCLVFVGVAFTVAIAVISLNQAGMTILLSCAIALVLWRLWERDRQHIAIAETERLSEVERQHQTAIETFQSELDRLSHQKNQTITEIANCKREITELNVKLDTLEATYQTTTKELEALKKEYSKQKESEHQLLEEAIANEEKAKQLAIERDQFLLKTEELEREIEQRITERDRDRNINQALTEQINQLEQEISRLERELTHHKKVTSPNPATREMINRPPSMDDLKFAKIATIRLDPLPNAEILMEETKQHYDRRNGGFDRSPIKLNSIAEYLCHRYSNYDDLCYELSSYNKRARNILKCRVNMKIWTALSELEIHLED